MKALVLLFFISLFTFGTAFAQKKDIDTDLLINLIDQKQQEAARRLLLEHARSADLTKHDKDFIGKTLVPLLSYRSKLSTQNLINSLMHYDITKSHLSCIFSKTFHDDSDSTFVGVYKIKYSEAKNYFVNRSVQKMTVRELKKLMIEPTELSDKDIDSITQTKTTIKRNKETNRDTLIINDNIVINIRQYVDLIEKIIVAKNNFKDILFNIESRDSILIRKSALEVMSILQRIPSGDINSTISELKKVNDKVVSTFSQDNLKYWAHINQSISKLEKQPLKEIQNKLIDTLRSSLMKNIKNYSESHFDFDLEKINKQDAKALKGTIEELRNCLLKARNKSFTMEVLDLFLASIRFTEKDDDKFAIQIDQAGFILDVLIKFDKNTIRNRMERSGGRWAPLVLLNIGLNLNNTYLENEFRTYYFASEKIGLKWLIWDWSYTRNMEKYKEFNLRGNRTVRLVDPKDPFVSKWHFNVYASGILYNLANLRASSMPNDPIFGIGTSIELYNKLTIGISYGSFISNSSWKGAFAPDKRFLGISIDIPIVEYLAEWRAKNK